jgi:Glycosyl hydrolase family 10
MTMMVELGATRREFLTFAATLGFARGAEPGSWGNCRASGPELWRSGSNEQFADRAYLDFFPAKALFYTRKCTKIPKVAARAGAFLSAVLKVPAVKMVICWGLTDRYMWWRDASTRQLFRLDRLPRPLPYDDQLLEKPMWIAMAEAFRRRS